MERRFLVVKLQFHWNAATAIFEVAHGVVLYPQLDCLGGFTEGGSNNILKVDLE